jgi:hypothetical protein
MGKIAGETACASKTRDWFALMAQAVSPAELDDHYVPAR